MKKLFIAILIFIYTFTYSSEVIKFKDYVELTAFAENSADDSDTDKASDEDESNNTKKSNKSNTDKTKKSKKKSESGSDDEDKNKKSDEDEKTDEDSSSEDNSKEDEEDERSKERTQELLQKYIEDEYVIHAEKYLVYDMTYNVNLITRNNSKRMNPAGLTKILTAITVIENVEDVNQEVTVPDGILRDYDYSYADVGLSSGKKTTYMNLLKLMMIRDAGDCAVALSHLCTESYNDFIRKMNETAKKAGVTNSYFDNPAGFSSSKNYSTLDDLCLIIKYALGNEIFREVASCSYLEIPTENPDAEPRRYFNKNYYMSSFYSLDYYNPNIKYGKEYTVDENNTGLFVNYNNGFYDMICLCAESYIEEGTNYAYEDINSLVNTAKNDFATVSLVQKDEIITEVPLRNGSDSDRVLLVAGETIRTKLANDYDPQKISRKLILNDKIKAPVKKGDPLGVITVNYNGIAVGSTNLVAFSDVNSSFMRYLLYYFDMIIRSGWLKTIIVLAIIAIIGYSYIKYKSKNRKRK